MMSKSKLVCGITIFLIGSICYSSKTLMFNNADSSSMSKLYIPVQRMNPPPHPRLKLNDIIYSTERNTVPIVNEEYRIVFFQVAKVASSEWMRFFVRLNDDPTWCSNKRIHDKEENGLKYLSDFPREEAREMMTNPEWTKAVFVRHPKSRILSAFLDKAIEKSTHFIQNSCRVYWFRGENYDDCLNRHEDFDFFLQEITTTLPDNVHWRSIYSRIDEKWWPYINFIGNMENMSDDATALLTSIHSSVTGTSAWDKIGRSGWSDNERDCESTINSKGVFLGKRDQRHTTSARDKMLQYYTPELEDFVEKRYADDLNNNFFQFETIELFKQGKRR